MSISLTGNTALLALWCFINMTSLLRSFYISLLGELPFFLDLKIQQTTDGIFLSLEKYLKKILKKYGMEECKWYMVSYDEIMDKPWLLFAKEYLLLSHMDEMEVLWFGDKDRSGRVWCWWILSWLRPYIYISYTWYIMIMK